MVCLMSHRRRLWLGLRLGFIISVDVIRSFWGMVRVLLIVGFDLDLRRECDDDVNGYVNDNVNGYDFIIHDVAINDGSI